MVQAAKTAVRAGSKQVTHAQAASAASLTTLVYRSRAIQPFSSPELLGLTEAAQRRNRSESITGLVLYDDARFFQWLEGPDENLSRITQSINNDLRHTDIEVLTRQKTSARTFAGWDMKLALPNAMPAPWTRNVIRPSVETLEALRGHPEIAAAVMEQSAPRCGSGTGTTAILEAVMRMEVIPPLASRYHACRPASLPGPSIEQASRLADFALTGETEAPLALARQVMNQSGSPYVLSTPLFEAAARNLGDMWLRDDCSEFDVTLGLCTLQMVLRQMEQYLPVATLPATPTPSALIVTHPSEIHGLSAALSTHILDRAGWHVRCAFPDSDDTLTALVADNWFDRLEVSLSAAFRREDRLEAMARTITLARSASLNPALQVVVSGRIFAEQNGRAVQVGADMPNNALPAGLLGRVVDGARQVEVRHAQLH